MRAIAILAFACFAFPVISQEVPNAQKQAQCRFSNGNVITITYLSDHMNAARLTTDEQVITVKGRNVPPGDYRIVPAKDHNNWFLKMRRTANGQSLGFLSLPLSVKQRGSRAERLDIAFDHTGGSCTMHWDSEDSKLILSLEFTEKNADLPVIP